MKTRFHLLDKTAIYINNEIIRAAILFDKIPHDKGTGLVDDNILPLMKEFYQTFIINQFGTYINGEIMYDFLSDYYSTISNWHYWRINQPLQLLAYYNYLMSNKFKNHKSEMLELHHNVSLFSDKNVNTNYDLLERGFISKNCLLYHGMRKFDVYDKNKIQIPYFDITKKLEFELFIKDKCKIDLSVLDDKSLFFFNIGHTYGGNRLIESKIHDYMF